MFSNVFSINQDSIFGTHNDVEFRKVLVANGGRVLTRTPTGAPGITHYKYEVQVPLKDRTGKVVGSKPLQREKTTYDPNVYSDAEMLDMAKQAAAQGYHKAVEQKQRQYEETVNGVNFLVSLDKNTGVVTNVYPTE